MANKHAMHIELCTVLQLCSSRAGTQIQPSWSTRSTLQTVSKAERAASGVPA